MASRKARGAGGRAGRARRGTAGAPGRAPARAGAGRGGTPGRATARAGAGRTAGGKARRRGAAAGRTATRAGGLAERLDTEVRDAINAALEEAFRLRRDIEARIDQRFHGAGARTSRRRTRAR